jgi:hypothetical protein
VQTYQSVIQKWHKLHGAEISNYKTWMSKG